MTIKEQSYEGHKQYVCSTCRPQWDTFDKAVAKAHDEANIHRSPGVKEPESLIEERQAK